MIRAALLLAAAGFCAAALGDSAAAQTLLPAQEAPAVSAGPDAALLAARARAGLRAAARARATAEASLAVDRAAALATLAALDRLGRAPPLAFYAHPGGPVGAARAAGVLRVMAPMLERRRVRMQDALRDLGEAASALSLNEARLATAARAGRTAPGETPTPRPPATAPLERAIAALWPPAAARPSMPDDAAPPPWPAPVAGAASIAADGRLTVKTEAYAPLRAPWAATVRHTGRPRGGGAAGATIVLEPATGVLVAFSGLGPIAATLGETLRPGAVFAAMGGPAPTDDDFLIEEAARPVPAPPQTLYVTLWIDGAPANPAEWFAMDGERTTW